MRKALYILLISVVLPLAMCGQNKEVMTMYQNQIQQMLEKVYGDPTDNQRYNANEQMVQLFQEALEQEGSIYFKWDLGNKVSVLTSSDKQFRILTWPVVRDNGEYECFGFVQSWNEKGKRFDVFQLYDKSDEVVTAEESVLFPESWFGCVYQTLIETKHEGKTYYTLLGWTGVDNLTQRKVVEPIFFRPGQSKPQFGQAVFKKEKNQRRMVLEYSRNAMVNLVYDEQFNRVVETKKVKKNGRMINQQEVHNVKEKMIIFDELAPAIAGMEGLYQYYVPTGTEVAYIFNGGKWERHEAHGRLSNPKLNKEFAPLKKNDPAYKLKNND